MEKMLFILCIVFGLSACNTENAQEVGQYTTIEVREVYDMGTVAKGEVIKVKIELKNTGSYPLVIANVKPACSCTVPSYDKNPVKPGATAVILAEVDTDKTGKGIISKPVNIVANTQPSTTTVIIKAKVID